MFGFGGIVRHNITTLDRTKIVQNVQNNNIIPNQPAQAIVSIPQEEENYGNQNSRANFTENKMLPSEINAETLRISIHGVSGQFIVDSTAALISKIYFQKKQFIWEYTDNTSSEDKQKKRRIEVKFGDIVSISVHAKEGQTGNIIITTNKPISLNKEKQNAPGKNTQ